MAPIAIAAFNVGMWIVNHREQIKGLVLGVEDLMKDAPGNVKRDSVITFVDEGIKAEGKFEADVQQAWPFIGTMFNGFVAKVKADAAKAASPAIPVPALAGSAS